MASASGSSSYAPLSPRAKSPREASVRAAVVPITQQEALAQRRRDRAIFYIGLCVAYLVAGMLIFSLTMGWTPLESLVFNLSVLTGVGYGHVSPPHETGMLICAGWIVLGLTVFATAMGQILDYIVAAEIAHAAELAKQEKETATTDLVEQRHSERRTNFMTGAVNVVILFIGAVLWFTLSYGEGVTSAIYKASITVMKLDSLCFLDGIHCGAGADQKDLAISVVWTIITYGVVGHFLVSASSYFGYDPEPTMTTIRHLNMSRFERIDKDGDGKITRSEYLRDRIIQANALPAEEVEMILASFDKLDKDGSGAVTKADLMQA
eukprot:TRINITY_DN25687_c0_g1_i1.p1 TRINITY_DN25687_c0_g1~~TRINITY_DN25687_c0_g1_i1.p1  ORF type:complete len:322 (+),score=56.15 TRINITY_DN25687_c0_g1_i1:147-1112(+)